MRINIFTHEVASVHAAALILGAAGLLSRLVGVLRNRLLFAEFGAGRELDIYYAAFQIPDFMAVLFLLGAASAAILPLFQEYLIEDKKKAQEFIGALSFFFALGAILASIFAFFLIPAMVPLVAPGFSMQEREVMVTLTRLMLVSPILFGLSGIFSVVVQSYKLFFVYALAPILYNLGILFGIVFLVPRFGIYGLGIGVVMGALFHVILQLGSAARLGFWPRMRARAIQGVKKVLLLSLPRVLTISFTQLTVLALIAIGSTLAEGSVAIFSAAQDLYFVPIGIFGVSYTVAIFPRLALARATRSGEDFWRELFSGTRSILFWVAPSAVLFLVLRAHIVRVALGAGAFSWEDTRLSAAVLATLAIAMAAGAVQTLLIRGFYALGNTRVPLMVTTFTSICSVALAWASTALLASGSEASQWILELFRIADIAHPEVLGLGIGFSAGLVANVVTLWVLLVHAGEASFQMRWEKRRGEILKIIIAAVCAGVAAYIVRASFSQTLPLITFLRVLAQGAAAAGVGLTVYVGILSYLSSEDVTALLRSVRRHLFSIGILPSSWDGEQHNV